MKELLLKYLVSKAKKSSTFSQGVWKKTGGLGADLCMSAESPYRILQGFYLVEFVQ